MTTLKRFYQSLDMNATQFAKETGVSMATITNINKGRHGLKPENMDKIIRRFGRDDTLGLTKHYKVIDSELREMVFNNIEEILKCNG